MRMTKDESHAKENNNTQTLVSKKLIFCRCISKYPQQDEGENPPITNYLFTAKEQSYLFIISITFK